MIRVARVLALLVCVLPLVAFPAMPSADAGGSWLNPVQDRYEPGDVVTLVGYTGAGQYGTVSDGPFYGYLFRGMDDDSGPHPRAIPLPVGELELSRSGEYGMFDIRAAITFTLPEDARPGTYLLHYCNDGCEEQLGHLIGGVFHVGVDPPYPVAREWPLTEPEMQNLDDDALIVSFGGPVRAGDLDESPSP